MLPRRLSSSLLCGALLAALVCAISREPATGRAATAGPQGDGPRVNVAAFRGQGHLAFLWNGGLDVLDGSQGALHTLTRPGQTHAFTWSPSGKWLAYDAGPQGHLWLARADGSATHQVAGLPAPVASFAWLPARDVLIIALAGSHVAQHLWEVTPTGRPRPVAAPAPWGLLSPDGRTVAYVVTLPFRDPETRSDALYTVAAAGGRPTRQLLALHDGIALVGWWPDGTGLLFWRDPYHSNSIAADGLGLYTLPLGGAPRLLTVALPSGLALSPSGHDALLMAGVGRELWHNKSLLRCAVEAAACRALPHPAGVVSLDPAWSPRGDRIAYVQAQDRGSAVGMFGFSTAGALLAWVHTHTLWVADASGGHARALPGAGTGIYGPQWSGDGSHLLYIRDDALWLVSLHSGAPARIVGPFPGRPDLFGFYGEPYLPISFAWNPR